MKVAAFFLCILILASCKNQDEHVPSSDTLNNGIQDLSTNPLFAQIGFDNRVVDLGMIVPFDNNQIFYFTNEGDTTLVINDVYTESDQVEVFGFTYEVEPGEQGKIRLKLDPNLAHKSFSEYIFIRTNNNNTASLARLEVQFEISDQLEINGIFVEDGDRINVRMFPALDATVLFGLEKGDQVTCIGAMHKDYVPDFDSDLWYYVDYNGRKGWVLSALTDFIQPEVVAMKE